MEHKLKHITVALGNNRTSAGEPIISKRYGIFSFEHLHFANDSDFSSLSDDQRIMALVSESVLSSFIKNLKANNDESFLDAKNNISRAQFVYNKGIDPEKDGDLANVRSSIQNGQWIPGDIINIWGVSFSYFKTETPAAPEIGYDLPIRAGIPGVFDLLVHEYAHTFQIPKTLITPPSPTSEKVVMNALMKHNEQRADQFLKQAQVNNLIP